MFKTRLISGIILLAAAGVSLYAGGLILFLVLLLISLIGMHELYRALHVEESGPNALSLCGYLGAIVYYVLVYFRQPSYALLSLALVLNIMMAVYVFSWPKIHCEKTIASFFAIVYTAVMLSYIYQTRILSGGIYAVWLIFICSWGSDTCAYCVGMLIGKHKMAPVLSPKKSIEGAVGGVAGAAILGALYGLILGKAGQLPGAMRIPAAEFALICAVGAVISMVGDLAASAIKRNMQIKDYGKLIPGHGGILDRFDSVIFTAPVIWLLCSLLLHL